MDDTVVSLQSRDILLNLHLFLRMLLNVVTNLTGEIQVDVADFVHVQVFGNDDVEPQAQRVQEEDGFDGDVRDQSLDLGANVATHVCSLDYEL